MPDPGKGRTLDLPPSTGSNDPAALSRSCHLAMAVIVDHLAPSCVPRATRCCALGGRGRKVGSSDSAGETGVWAPGRLGSGLPSVLPPHTRHLFPSCPLPAPGAVVSSRLYPCCRDGPSLLPALTSPHARGAPVVIRTRSPAAPPSPGRRPLTLKPRLHSPGRATGRRV